MIPRFERFVAFRYLWSAQGSSEGKKFLRIVTLIAISGVAVGVAALLLALAIVRGFSGEITEKIISFGSHVQVRSYGGDIIGGSGHIKGQLEEIQSIQYVLPVIQEFALLRRSAQEIDGVLFSGIEEPSPAFRERMIEGSLAFEPDSGGRPALVVGKQLTRLLDLELGSTVTAYSIRDSGEGGGISRPRVKQFYIAGIYETSFARYDEFYVFTRLSIARELFEYGEDEITRFDVYLSDVDMAQDVADVIDEEIGFPLIASTVFQVFRQYFAWVRLQQTITPIVISLIVLVAAFNIFGTLLMIMFEKTREIGVLGGMGASPLTIFRLFLILGISVGGVGVVLGQFLALGLALIQKKYSIIPLPEESYYMDVAPVALNGLDFVIVGLSTLLLCAVAACIPAFLATFIKPIQAIRFR